MPSSFEKINYNLRPNKCIERKMMSEALGRLSFIDDLDTYGYIGFGSPYFADFILFHKNLGIKDLISIEQETTKSKRFDFNVPYSGIKMIYGHSNTVLPNLELSLRRNIVWLDYDDKVSDFMFSDINTFFSEAMPGSFFIISVNVEEDFMKLLDDNDEKQPTLKEFRLNQLIERVGKERLPSEIMEHNMNTKNLSNATYQMIERQISTSLLNRNGNKKDTVEFLQVFNFSYKDNATILTVGGILFDKSQRVAVKKMAFNKLPFYSDKDESYKIQCPNLTFREIKALDKLLPSVLERHGNGFKNDAFNKIPLIVSDIEKYAKVYRYYPTFTEANI
jgi:hypothetical protein